MNDTSSKYDKFVYEPKLETHEEYTFKPIDGVGIFEWSNIASLARSIKNLIFVDCCLANGIHTTDRRYEEHIRDAKRGLCEALAEAVIEVDERRKHRRENGYAQGGPIQKDMEQGMTIEDAAHKVAVDVCAKMGIGKKGNGKDKKK